MSTLDALCQRTDGMYAQMHHDLEIAFQKKVREFMEQRSSLSVEIQQRFDALWLSIRRLKASKPKPSTVVVSLLSDDEDDEDDDIQIIEQPQSQQISNRLDAIRGELVSTRDAHLRRLNEEYESKVKKLDNQKKQQQINLNNRHRETIDRLKAVFEPKYNSKPMVSLLSDDDDDGDNGKETVNDTTISVPFNPLQSTKDNVIDIDLMENELITITDDDNQSEMVSNRIHNSSRNGISTKILQCEHCEYSTPNASSLRIHQRTHTNERPFKCHLCDRTFTVKCNMKHHIRRIHKKDFPHHCSYCTRKFMYPYQLKEHENLHTGATPFECSHCNQSFASNVKLKKHLRSHHEGYKCRICHQVFKRKFELKIHRDTMHVNVFGVREPGDTEWIGAGWFKFGCSVCRLRFKTEEELNEHQRWHSQNECSRCHLMFPTTSDLAKHNCLQDDGQKDQSETDTKKMISSESTNRDDEYLNASNDCVGEKVVDLTIGTSKDDKHQNGEGLSCDAVVNSECEEDSDISML